LKPLIYLALILPALPGAFAQKSYKHASEYIVAVLDQNQLIATGTDLTLGKTRTDAKLSGGGQGFHFLHTDSGDYRVEAPVNKGASFVAAMGTPRYQRAPTIHNKWFLDNVQPGTKVLFSAHCSKPNKKHPNDTVKCEFYFPDPDSDSHEYATLGDFTIYIAGDGSNTQKTANSLCGTGKLNAATEAQICK
jgi:hypothetical protein